MISEVGICSDNGFDFVMLTIDCGNGYVIVVSYILNVMY